MHPIICQMVITCMYTLHAQQPFQASKTLFKPLFLQTVRTVKNSDQLASPFHLKGFSTLLESVAAAAAPMHIQFS